MMRDNTLMRGLIGTCLTLILLAGCGGGGGGYGGSSMTASTTPATTTGSGTGTTTPPPAYGMATVSGTVTGFGSVIVDGTRIDNHLVVAAREMEDGRLQPVQLMLGDHVDVEHDGNLLASFIRVRTAVEGPVASINLAAGTLLVLDQTVVVNSDATKGPVTVFGPPYTKLADIKAADVVAVHAVIKVDAGGKVTLQATRIAKDDDDAYYRVRGIVAALSTTAHSFKLGDLLVDYSQATLNPASATLANGQEVRVSVLASSVTNSATTTVSAKFVSLMDRRGETGTQEAVVGGPISALDAGAKTLTVDGVKVDASSAGFRPSGDSFANLSLGLYVVVHGTFGTDGTLKASGIALRGIDNDENDADDNVVEIHGTIMNFVSSANFTLRGVQVDASSAKLNLAACGSGITQLAANLQIEVRGTLAANGTVNASSVSCEPVMAGTTVVERSGVVTQVNAATQSMTLTTASGDITVQWGSGTTVLVDTASLVGKSVAVQGTTSGSVLLGQQIGLGLGGG
jgi:hypothetical protein